MRNTVNNDDVDILELQEAAKNASAYYREQYKFQRNAKLSSVVHAILNASQFLIALMDEIFHHLHHAIHKILKAKDPNVPDLPEERNPVFYVYPICMCISLILGILWLFTTFLKRNPALAAIGCAIGVVLMLIGGIFAMRHAEIHINLNEVSDKELLDHPIFIHNFVLCIFSISGMDLYLIQAWILFDCWRWKIKNKSESSSNYETESEETSEIDGSSENEKLDEPMSVSVLQNLPVQHADIHKNPEEEPVILYCCCIDCWNYIKESYFVKKPTHEFRVVHVM